MSTTSTGNDSTDSSRSSQYKISALAFNQDCTALSVGTSRNYVLFTINSENIEIDRTRHYLPFEEVRIIERLFLSALTIVVTQQEPKMLKIFHFKKGSKVCSPVFEKPILAVKLNRTRVIVCLEDSIYLHDMHDMKVLHRLFDLPLNLDGLCALSPNETAPYLAYPDSEITGTIQIFDTEKLKQINVINAHENQLVAMAFDLSGLLIATASIKGTLIRVHNVVDGKCVAEYRRGSMRAAKIYSLAFSPDSKFLAASSDTETIHIFRLPSSGEQQPAQDTSTWTGFFGSYLNGLTNERSFATVHFQAGEMKRILGMKIIDQQLRLFVADHHGLISIYEVNTKLGGECRQVGQHDLLPILENAYTNETSRRSSASSPINVAGSSSKYPQNRIQNNAYDLSQSPPMLTNSKSGANQSFDTAIEDPPYSSTPSTDYD